MKFAILGPIELCAGERRSAAGRPQQIALLAFLLLHANRAVSTDQLHDALWSAQEPAGTSKRVQAAIARLRRSLAALENDGATSALRTVRGGYVLAVAAGELDAQVFADRVTEGRALLDGGDAGAASRALRDALALWRGPPLAEVAFADFAQPEIRRLEELRLTALESRLDAELALGRHGDAIGELQTLVAAHPGRERLCEQLMLALYRCGRQSDALDAYARLSARLSAELGLRPGPALQTLQQAVLEHAVWLDPDVVVPAVRLDAVAQPACGADAAPAAPFALPPALALHDEEPLVGRAAATSQVASARERAQTRVRQLVLVCGEPGSGKTRLAREVARDAHEAGAIVLYGRCDEESLLPHQPFVEALRHYVGACPQDLLEAQVSLVSGELRRMVPELAERVPALGHPLPDDPEGARHRLFEAVAALLCEAGQQQLLVLVLDDLHWAEESTLLLLKYVARYPRQARLLIVAAYRDTDVGVAHPLSGVLADLARDQSVERVALGRLDAASVAELVGWHTGGRASADLRRMVFTETHGLAFFVVEVARDLSDGDGDDPAASGDELRAPRRLPLPEAVRGHIGRRLARLGPETSRVLETAAVLGSTFAFELLEYLCDIREDDLVDALERAVRAQLVDEPGSGDERHAFSHALIRDVLYAGLTQTRRALLHRRAADAIEAVQGDEEPPFAELAHHLVQAGAAKDLDRALVCLTRAAEQARAQLAYEQAAAHLRQAIGLLDQRRVASSPGQRCELLIARGEAERMAGDVGHRETLLAAAQLAEQTGDAPRLARAALANSRPTSTHLTDCERVAAVEAALALLGDDDPATRADLLAQLAIELGADDDWRRREGVADEALTIARRVGRPATLARVLTQHAIATWYAPTLPARTVNLRESLELADHTGDPLLAANAAFFGFWTALENGDRGRADEMIECLAAHAKRLGQPMLRWFEVLARASRCAVVGAPREAEALGFSALELGQRAGQPDAEVWFIGHLYTVRLVAGTLAEGEPNLQALLETPGSSPVVGPEFRPGRSIPLMLRAATSAILCEVGRAEDARAHLKLVLDDIDDLPADYSMSAILASSAIACAHLQEPAVAQKLHALLEPCSDQFVNAGTFWLGAVAHHLAVLQATMGMSDGADELFKAAEQDYTRLGAATWLARCRLDHASLLLERARAGDAQRASGLIAEALTTARALDLRGVTLRAAALSSRATAAS